MANFGSFESGDKDLSVKIVGLSEAMERLSQLPVQMQKSAIGSSLRQAAKPIAAAMKAKAGSTGSGSGALAESVGIRGVSKSKLKGNQVSAMLIGPLRDSPKALIKYAAYYGKTLSGKLAKAGIRHGHLVEFGHSVGGTKVGARPFMRPAFDANIAGSMQIFRQKLGQRTDAIIKKLNKRAAKQRAK